MQWSRENPNPDHENGEWTIACLTFYRRQETRLRDMLRKLCNLPRKMSRFNLKNLEIRLCTVDKFQGQEADLVFLSMVQTRRIGLWIVLIDSMWL